jgi:hypothetical protein
MIHSHLFLEEVAEACQTFVTPTFFKNYLSIRTADVTGGNHSRLIAVSVSGVSAINPLVAFYDSHGRKRAMLFFYFVTDTTRDTL